MAWFTSNSPNIRMEHFAHSIGGYMFRVGDSVRLKSGGPAMSIFTLLDGGECSCQWFDGSELKSGYFNFAQLQSEADYQKAIAEAARIPSPSEGRSRLL
ncbi:YodC family protein [Aeromonas veronii]